MSHAILCTNGLDFPFGEADFILTDPVYDEMPHIEELLDQCRGTVIVFCDPMKRPAKKPDEILFWIKQASTKNNTKKCSNFVEEIMVYRKGSYFNPNLHWSAYTGLFYDKIIEHNGHPWQKPVAMLEVLISLYCPPDDIVYDPFMGSGSTGVAAILTGRHFRGCEIEPVYYEIAKNRLKKYS